MVPADVQCIQITATGTRVKQQNFVVMPGQSSILSMNGLPVGLVTFTGEAFTGGCGGGPTGAQPTFVADPVTAQINATGVTALTLNMRRNGQASISVDFENGVMCVPAGGACSATASCCTGLSCQDAGTGMLTCQPQNMCTPAGGQCSATSVCCSGLSCQADPTGVSTCVVNVCMPAGMICGPGMAQQCCAGLTCQLDPATQTPRCQTSMCIPGGALCSPTAPCCGAFMCTTAADGTLRCL